MVESTSDLQPIVLRLDEFHTKMSFWGTIGHVMCGSGLQELLEVTYAQNAIGHMMSGKAVSRALRGHLLVNAALNTLVASKALIIKPGQLSNTDTDRNTNDLLFDDNDDAGDDESRNYHDDEAGIAEDLLGSLAHLLQDVLLGTVSPSEVESNQSVQRLKRTIDSYYLDSKAIGPPNSGCKTWKWWICS